MFPALQISHGAPEAAPVDARIVANAVLGRAAGTARPLTNLDVQKIVYFLHGHYLLRHRRPLVQGEFEAWPYGPVHRVLYDAFRDYDASPIDRLARAFDPIKRTTREMPALADKDAVALLDEFLDYYLGMSTYSLVELTHGAGTPWSRTVEDGEKRINVGMRISNELIRDFFEGFSPQQETTRESAARKRERSNHGEEARRT
jgi:uncharacterized phage-associated protein